MTHWSCRTVLYFVAIAAAAAELKYKPFSDVAYDLGPIDKCVKSPMTSCYTKYGLSNDTTTPAFMAKFHHMWKKFYFVFEKVLTMLPLPKECKPFLSKLFCTDLVQPVCFKNGTAALTGIISQEQYLEINKKLLSCLPLSSNNNLMINMVLTIIEKLLPTRKPPYPLKQCREVNLPRCAKNPRGSTTPEYLAASVELRYTFAISAEPVFRAVWPLEDVDKCLNESYRSVCTYPTCTSDNRLQGYKTKEECLDGFDKCFPSPSQTLVKAVTRRMREVMLHILCELFPSKKEVDAWSIISHRE